MCMECVVLDIMEYCWYYLGHSGGHVGITGHIGDHAGIHVPCWAQWGQRRAHAAATATTAVVATAAKAAAKATAATVATAVAAPEAMQAPVQSGPILDQLRHGNLRIFARVLARACVCGGFGPRGGQWVQNSKGKAKGQPMYTPSAKSAAGGSAAGGV
jgi:hypothetical protein